MNTKIAIVSLFLTATGAVSLSSMAGRAEIVEGLPDAGPLVKEGIQELSRFQNDFNEHKEEITRDLDRAREDLVRETDPYAMKLGTGLPTAKFVVDLAGGALAKASEELNANQDEIVRQVQRAEGEVQNAPELAFAQLDNCGENCRRGGGGSSRSSSSRGRSTRTTTTRRYNATNADAAAADAARYQARDGTVVVTQGPEARRYNGPEPRYRDYNRNQGRGCRAGNMLDLPGSEEAFTELVGGMGEIAREFFREAERDPRRAQRFEREIDREVLRPVQEAAKAVGASTDGLPTGAQIRETMGGVLRGIIYGVVMNKRDVTRGVDELSCDLNMMVQEAMQEIQRGFQELGVELKEPHEWKDVQGMIVQTLEAIQNLERNGEFKRPIQELESVAGHAGVKLNDAALQEGLSEGLEGLKQVVINTDERQAERFARDATHQLSHMF